MFEPDTSDFNLIELTRKTQDEVRRQMTICNACRYCEGLCAVFPAMELRRSFDDHDVDYLANLCHNCGACYEACQYVPPHEFAVNIPQAMAELRENSYQRFVWPAPWANLFRHNAFWSGITTVAFVVAFVVGILAWYAPQAVFSTRVGTGAFYALIPHDILVAIFGILFAYAILATALSARRFWRATHDGKPLARGSIIQALFDVATLRYLHGGGPGCTGDASRPHGRRRWFHHATAYGFLLCFASTCLGTVCHYAGDVAPYPLWHPVVILGVLGGIGLVVGPIGLLVAHPALPGTGSQSSDTGLVFLIMLLAAAISGLAVLLLRATPVMGLVFMVHLGIIAGFFVSIPYGKFVHGIYRGAALLQFAHEQRRANKS